MRSEKPTDARGGADPLLAATWQCGCTVPGRVGDPAGLEDAAIEWWPAEVPGTAAGALRQAGRWHRGRDDEQLLDGRDWWFRCRFSAPESSGPWVLTLEGLATLADVWLDHHHVLRSENMFTSHNVELAQLGAEHELTIRCAALAPVLARRHPRPRWKSRLVAHQSLRWYRTTLLGRVPGWSRWAAPVGPWRPVRLRVREPEGELRELQLRAELGQGGGVVSLRARLEAPVEAPAEAFLCVEGRRAPLTVTRAGSDLLLQGECLIPDVALWWPHTHGSQPLYDVELELDGRGQPLRRVGFRAVELDRTRGAFRISVNGVPIFCRGALWGPADPVTLRSPADEVRGAVALAREAGMNMLRVPGYGFYEDRHFWDACDELGVMVWQDCMLASYDPPADPAFLAALDAELSQVLGALGGRPALAMVCGSSETYQQASMYGLPRARWESDLLERHIPERTAELAPGVPYVSSSPSGGDPPFTTGEGVSHYFGVGAYLRGVQDARLAGVRFAAECLSFGTPPERETMEAEFQGAQVVGHDARWKQTVAQDAGTAWDFEDVRDHYVRALFHQEPAALRYADAEHAVDLGRAAVAEVMTQVLGEWRRAGSPCDGALILCWRDLWPGAGWGLLDARGLPKAPFHPVRRVFSPTTVVIVDEGLAGLELNVLHDRAEPVELVLRLRVFDALGNAVEAGARELQLAPRSATAIWAHTLLDGWRDLNASYCFTPPVYDVVAAELCDRRAGVIARSFHLPGGPARPRLPDVGLRASATRDAQGGWWLTVCAELFAQYVAVDVPGYRAADAWFHLLPREPVTIALRGEDSASPPTGTVRALNAARTSAIVVGES